MSLQARVGRHTRNGGRHIKNKANDQQTVTELLNGISTSDGGAAGSLNGHIVAGICGESLYGAISKFEDKYFPSERSGYVDPGGAMLQLMERLIALPGSAPAPAQVGP